MCELLDWAAWTNNQQVQVGGELIGRICEATSLIRVIDAPYRSWEPRPNNKSQSKIVELEDGTVDRLKKQLDNWALLRPQFLPTIIPPKPWDGPHDGGYWSHHVRGLKLIRLKKTMDAG